MSSDETADHPCAHQQELHGGRESSTLCARFGWDEKSESQTAAKVYFKQWEKHLGWQQRMGDELQKGSQKGR